MKSVSIITLGCKVNQVESEQIAEKLEAYGYAVSMGLGSSDIYIINTCAVTNEAERKSRNIISKILKVNKSPEIYVCGCSSENNPENFKKGDYVKGIIGTNDKVRLADMIAENDGLTKLDDINCEYTSRVTTRTRAVLWVQNGCNNFCTYCLIPYLRGREVSFPLEDVKKEIARLEKQANEIVVTGINLSAYGKDFEKSDGLIEVARLFKNSNARFRFSSLEVNVITNEFLSELASLNNFCDHFHLSLQSGSNNTLKSMNRHYTKEEYLEKVNLIRKYFPNAGITTDIIIGFPTETEDDFNESLEFAKTVNFSEMHIFPYSKRNGTVAEKFKNIATNIPERVSKMTAQAADMKNAFITQNIGKTHEVIIENQKNGYYLAHTKNFILCYIESNEPLEPNSYQTVVITEAYEDGAKAQIKKM
ncbi:MAG: tRNA (N(6)-L-threonylcarbamoyladenosine(37)-C(2))-methylthiotransferase MtaB [Clostridia bacterium]|nr:tRNA (N(6)-L-threonylcarbamoyladenosine(37)-C(2))-methylthiotransferase MtaB [Clostridia bacterium]